MYLDLLKQINEHDVKKYNEPLFNEAVPQGKLDNFVKESQMALQYTPCDEYLDLLKLTDGYDNCNDDGVEFYSIEDFLFQNIDWRKTNESNRYIIFGSTASAPIYLYDTEKKVYIISDRYYFPDNEDKKFNSFGELVSAVLQPRVIELA